MIDIEQLRGWIGRSETLEDTVSSGPAMGLTALFDRGGPVRPDVLPPLWHWLYAMPRVPSRDIGPDGHPKLGGFLPPSPLPRRMWAGGKVHFAREIAFGSLIQRRSTIADVTAKSGASGDLVFVAVEHEILHDGRTMVSERQDIVYRGAGGPAAPGPAVPAGAVVREVTMDAVQLFRFSALTFNGHRIHYDRDFARDVEGYPGLVVHGPLQAMLLMEHFREWRPDARVLEYSYRAKSPLFDGERFTLNLEPTDGGARLWTAGPSGAVSMEATVAIG